MKTDTKQLVVLVASFLVGVVAFALTHVYLAREYDALERKRLEIEAGMQRIKVLVADKTLPPGTAIQASDVAMKSVPRGALGGEPVLPNEYDMIEGTKVNYQIEKEQPILWNAISTPYKGGSGLAGGVKRRMRAISISAGGASAVSGLIRPNDRVDVLGTFSLPSKSVPGELETVTMTILQNVTVLAVGTQTARSSQWTAAFGRSPSQATGYNMVTLEVSPGEAELLVFAGYMKGKLTLSLRNTADLDYLKNDDLKRVDFDDLQNKIPEYNDRRQRTMIDPRYR